MHYLEQGTKERETALYLARMGFELVFQSLRSRGAFDLLATRNAVQLAVQVKHSDLPLRFKKTVFNRMEAEAKRFGWQWVIAAVSPSAGNVQMLDPYQAHIGREVRLTKDTIIENLLLWLDSRT